MPASTRAASTSRSSSSRAVAARRDGRAADERAPAVEIAIQIADAVAEAHAAGFVHGGLSPDSIMITAKGHAKIPAFELASQGGLRAGRWRGEAARLRLAGRGARRGGGRPLGHLFGRRRPVRDAHDPAPLHRGAAAPSASNPHVPQELDDIVLKAVAPNPDSRYQSAATLAAELRGVASILDARGAWATRRRPASTVDQRRASSCWRPCIAGRGRGRALVVYALVRISPSRCDECRTREHLIDARLRARRRSSRCHVRDVPERADRAAPGRPSLRRWPPAGSALRC